MRNSFVTALINEASVNDRIFLLTGDLGFAVLEPFIEKFPNRFINMGIAEQNMAGVAAGLAKEGFKVFCYSIGNFPTLRCMEQIRYDICYHNADVKIIAVGAGYAYGPLGASHHTTEDLGMLRVIPNLKVTAPADPVEVAAITKLFCTTKFPGYMRLNKAGEKNLHSKPIVLNGNELLPIIDGEKICVLACGAILQSAHDFILKNGLPWALYSCPFLNGIDQTKLLDLCGRYQRIITLEEHQLNCGFGSMILESINDLENQGLLLSRPKVRRIGIPNLFISTAGTQEHLRTKAGLNLQIIYDQLIQKELGD